MYSNPPGFSVLGILQAGILEWVTISFFIFSLYTHLMSWFYFIYFFFKYIFLLLGIILYSFPSFRVRRWPTSEESLEKRHFKRVRLLNKAPFQLFFSRDSESHITLWPKRKRQYLREWVTLSFRQPQPLGMILALIVSLGHSRRTEGGITELTVIVFSVMILNTISILDTFTAI